LFFTFYFNRHATLSDDRHAGPGAAGAVLAVAPNSGREWITHAINQPGHLGLWLHGDLVLVVRGLKNEAGVERIGYCVFEFWLYARVG
jgi:hypothetical protein